MEKTLENMFDIPVQVTVSYYIAANAWEPGNLSCTYEREVRSDSWPPDKISGSLARKIVALTTLHFQLQDVKFDSNRQFFILKPLQT
jgi:hypothetical protein